MARLIGVDLPRDKRLEVALTYIYGVGRTRAQQTLAATGISPDARVKDLGDAELVGVPKIVIVGRGAADGQVEFWDRRTGEREAVSVAEAVERLSVTR